MSDKDVFKQESADEKGAEGNTGTGTAKVDDPQPLDALVGEGKKYKSAEDLVSGFNASQEHISTLEAENKALRESADKAKGVQDVLDAVAAANTGQGESLDPEKVAHMIQDGIAANDEKTRGDANQLQVNTKFLEMFGEEAGSKVAKRAHELGMTVEAMKSMARTSPSAVLALFPQAGEPAKGSGETNPSKSTINTEALNLQPKSGGARQEYVDKRRAMNAEKAGSGDAWYFSAKTQNEIMGKATGEEGQEFFG